MLTASDKKQYMDIMHEFASIRAELEILLSPELQNEINEDSLIAENQVSATDNNRIDSNMAAADTQRLNELRSKLNL